MTTDQHETVTNNVYDRLRTALQQAGVTVDHIRHHPPDSGYHVQAEVGHLWYDLDHIVDDLSFLDDLDDHDPLTQNPEATAALAESIMLLGEALYDISQGRIDAAQEMADEARSPVADLHRDLDPDAEGGDP